MKWNKILETMDNNIVETVRNSILDIIVPLQNEGVQSLGINQIISILEGNPDLDGVTVDENLISKAINGIKGLSISTDISGDLNLNIATIDDVSPDDDIDTSSVDKVNAAAVRAAKKDW